MYVFLPYLQELIYRKYEQKSKNYVSQENHYLLVRNSSKMRLVI